MVMFLPQLVILYVASSLKVLSQSIIVIILMVRFLIQTFHGFETLKHRFLFCVNAIVPLWNCIGNKSNLKIKIIQGGILNKLRRPIVIGSAASESQCSKYSDLNMKHEFYNDSDRWGCKNYHENDIYVMAAGGFCSKLASRGEHIENIQ